MNSTHLALQEYAKKLEKIDFFRDRILKIRIASLHFYEGPNFSPAANVFGRFGRKDLPCVGNTVM
jgi:hypothetical protein